MDYEIIIKIEVHEPEPPFETDKEFIMDVLQYVLSGDLKFEYEVKEKD